MSSRPRCPQCGQNYEQERVDLDNGLVAVFETCGCTERECVEPVPSWSPADDCDELLRPYDARVWKDPRPELQLRARGQRVCGAG